MNGASRRGPLAALSIIPALLFLVQACTTRTEPMNQSKLSDFGARYAAAWSGRNPDALAAFYAVDGSLKVNNGPPSIGRAAIAAKAKEFMDAFPDMVVKMDSVELRGGGATFHWTWTGTNTGPGGTGKAVRISGAEEWRLGDDGLIRESRGHYDEAEYQRQMSR